MVLGADHGNRDPALLRRCGPRPFCGGAGHAHRLDGGAHQDPDASVGASDLAGTVSTALPIPDDGYRSEDVEYAALARAVRSLGSSVRVVEVGAGWALAVAMVKARQRGLPGIAVAVEADPRKCRWPCNTPKTIWSWSWCRQTRQLVKRLREALEHNSAAGRVVVQAAAW